MSAFGPPGRGVVFCSRPWGPTGGSAGIGSRSRSPDAARAAPSERVSSGDLWESSLIHGPAPLRDYHGPASAAYRAPARRRAVVRNSPPGEPRSPNSLGSRRPGGTHARPAIASDASPFTFEHSANRVRANARSPSRSARSHPRNARSHPRSARSPSRSARSPSRNARSPSRSARSPSRSARSPSRNARSPSRSARSPSRSARSPSRNARSPSRNARSPSRNARSHPRTRGGRRTPRGTPKSRGHARRARTVT